MKSPSSVQVISVSLPLQAKSFPKLLLDERADDNQNSENK